MNNVIERMQEQSSPLEEAKRDSRPKRRLSEAVSSKNSPQKPRWVLGRWLHFLHRPLRHNLPPTYRAYGLPAPFIHVSRIKLLSIKAGPAMSELVTCRIPRQLKTARLTRLGHVTQAATKAEDAKDAKDIFNVHVIVWVDAELLGGVAVLRDATGTPRVERA